MAFQRSHRRRIFTAAAVLAVTAAALTTSGCGTVFKRKPNAMSGSGGADTQIGVNAFLWRASLDTISFMPVASADPFGGVILTDWYQNPDTPGERFKMNVYILDRQLRADGVRVSVFKQKQERGSWHDVKVPDDMATNVENTILTRARELRVAQMPQKK